MITLYSLITTILWTSLLVLIMFVCRRSILFVRYFGVKTLLTILATCLLRLLFPIEISFSKVIVLPQILNPIHDILYSTINIKNDFPILSLIIFVWITVSIILVSRTFTIYIYITRKLSKIPSITTAQIDRVAKDIIVDSDNMKIILYPTTTVPMVCGFHKGIIFLPNIEYTDKELNFIIEHEYTHFKNHDAYIRLIVELFCMCFWWNPLIYLMKNDLDNILEIKCDMMVTQGKSKEEIVFYADTLLKFLDGNKAKVTPLMTSEFSNIKAIKQRINLLFAPTSNNKVQKFFYAVSSVILMLTFAFSYLFVFQSQYNTKYDDTMTDDVLYAQKNEDGTYSIYKGNISYDISTDNYEIMIADGFVVKNKKE